MLDQQVFSDNHLKFFFLTDSHNVRFGFFLKLVKSMLQASLNLKYMQK
jgi:hypothetical protein